MDGSATVKLEPDIEFCPVTVKMENDEDGFYVDSIKEEAVDGMDIEPDFVIDDTHFFGSDEESDDAFDDEHIVDSESSVSDDEDVFMIYDYDNENQGEAVKSALVENAPLPSFFLERTRKNEYGPPNAWGSKPPPIISKISAAGAVKTEPAEIRGPALALGYAPRPVDVWGLFFDADIIEKIVTNTNVKLATVRKLPRISSSSSNIRNTNVDEINALIGLLLLSSVLKSNSETMVSLFSKDEFSRPIFRATMTENRYRILVAHLCYNDMKTQEQKETSDKAAAISDLFQQVITNSQAVYRPSSNVTVGEILVPFRGRCSFKTSLKKCGIKMLCLADATTSYLYNAYIYTGENNDDLTEEEQKLSDSTQSLIRLCKVIEGTNSSVTSDERFTSLEAIEELGKMKLSYVGLLGKDQSCIPAEFLDDSRPVPSTLYGFRRDATILSFIPKKRRNLCLLSTVHNKIETNKDKEKPEMVCFFDRTKGGVNLLEKMCGMFSSSRKYRKWPLTIFYRLINICSVNAFVVYSCYNGVAAMDRVEFIKSIGKALLVPHLHNRICEGSNLPRELRFEVNKILGVNQAKRPVEDVPDDRLLSKKRKTCQKCPSSTDRKTNYKCIKCHFAICGKCQRRVCFSCARLCV